MDEHLDEPTESDPELDHLAESLDMVEAALHSLDRDDVDEAEKLVTALSNTALSDTAAADAEEG